MSIAQLIKFFFNRTSSLQVLDWHRYSYLRLFILSVTDNIPINSETSIPLILDVSVQSFRDVHNDRTHVYMFIVYAYCERLYLYYVFWKIYHYLTTKLNQYHTLVQLSLKISKRFFQSQIDNAWQWTNPHWIVLYSFKVHTNTHIGI